MLRGWESDKQRFQAVASWFREGLNSSTVSNLQISVVKHSNLLKI